MRKPLQKFASDYMETFDCDESDPRFILYRIGHYLDPATARELITLAEDETPEGDLSFMVVIRQDTA